MKKILSVVLAITSCYAFALGGTQEVSSDSYPVIIDPIVVNSVRNCVMTSFSLDARPTKNITTLNPSRSIRLQTSANLDPKSYRSNQELYGPAIYAPLGFQPGAAEDGNEVLAFGYASPSVNAVSYLSTRDLAKFTTSSNYNLVPDPMGLKFGNVNSLGAEHGFQFSPSYTDVGNSENDDTKKDLMSISAYDWFLKADMKCADSNDKLSTIKVANKQTVKTLLDPDSDKRGTDGVFTTISQMAFSKSGYQYQPLVFMILAYGDSTNDHSFSLISSPLNDLLAASCTNASTNPLALVNSDSNACSVELIPSKYNSISAVKAASKTNAFPFFSQFSTNYNDYK